MSAAIGSPGGEDDASISGGRREIAAILGFPDVQSAQRGVEHGVLALRQTLDDDRVENDERLWMLSDYASAPQNPRPLSDECLKRQDSPDAEAAWMAARTHGLISIRADDLASGFPSADGACALYFAGKPQVRLNEPQGVGSATLTTVFGGQNVALKYHGFTYFHGDRGIQGVEIPFANSPVEAFLFTAPDVPSLRSFEVGVDPQKWKTILSQFALADGALSAGLSIESKSFLNDYGVGSYFPTAFGGRVNSLSQSGALLTDDQSFRIAVTTNFQIDNPGCCTDAIPTSEPSAPFYMGTTAPVFVVVQDGSGVILFVAGT